MLMDAAHEVASRIAQQVRLLPGVSDVLVPQDVDYPALKVDIDRERASELGVNAQEVVELLRGLRAKVNLIALNPGPGIDYSTPDRERVLQFQQVLIQAGIPAFIRRPRGRDIFAACGQLKRTVEIATAPAR